MTAAEAERETSNGGAETLYLQILGSPDSSSSLGTVPRKQWLVRYQGTERRVEDIRSPRQFLEGLYLLLAER